MEYNKKKVKDIGVSIVLLIILNLITIQPSITKDFSSGLKFYQILLLLSPTIVANIMTLMVIFLTSSLNLVKKLLIIFATYICSFFMILLIVPIIVILIS